MPVYYFCRRCATVTSARRVVGNVGRFHCHDDEWFQLEIITSNDVGHLVETHGAVLNHHGVPLYTIKDMLRVHGTLRDHLDATRMVEAHDYVMEQQLGKKQLGKRQTSCVDWDKALQVLLQEGA